MRRLRRNREELSRVLLRRLPLPVPKSHDNKEGRGRVLIVGGEVALPGAVILAGVAALRAGAGKLQIATCTSIARQVGVAVPESMSIGLPESTDGTIAPFAAAEIRGYAERCDAVLIGPGMRESENADVLVRALLATCRDTPVVLDAGALRGLYYSPDSLRGLLGRAILTPHAAEMSAMTGEPTESVESDPAGYALLAAQYFNAVIALKGPTTFIATPPGDLFRYESGDIGLATSGSGDVLAGIIAGLVARGASPLVATLWGVFLHGSAGNALAKRVGRVGYLARELLDEIPKMMNKR